MTPIEEAAKEGYSQEEVQSYLSEKSQAARDAGYTDQEIQRYIKDDILQQPDFNTTPLKQQAQANVAARPAPTNFLEALETGYNWSVSGLGQEMMKAEGKLPTMATNADTPLYLQLTSDFGTVVGDLPAIAAGGILGGGPASPITAWAGGAALPQGLRKVFMDALENREFGTKKEFADRATGAMWETAKGMMVGAATGFVGKLATKSTEALGKVAKFLLPTVAENATMTEVSARLEGHAPEPMDFVRNGIILGVMKGVLPSWAAKPPRVLGDIYIKTGIPPEKVTQDAIKDSSIWQDALDGKIPEAYKEHIDQPRLPPTQAQLEVTKSPAMTPEQQVQAKTFMDQPFAEIPQAPNEPSRPTHMNYNRIQTTDDAKVALSQLSSIYEAKIKDKQQSPRAWEQSHNDAAKVLSDLLQSDPKTVTNFLKGEKAGPSTTAQLLARKELTLGFTEELMRSRAALVAKGDAATPEELATFLSHVERVSNVQAAFLGQRADVARALNALKSTKRDADRSQAILDAINQYGGPENVGKLVKLLGEYENPAQAIKFAKEATKATTWEMVVEAWKAGLVSGLRTNEVNFLSTAAFTTLRLPTEALAGVMGAARNAQDRVYLSEIPARMIGNTAGLRDGIKIAGAILRTGDNIYGPKTESFEPKIPGKTGEVIRLPFRFLASSDALLKSVNERGELYALATKQAILEGQPVGSRGFFERIADITANPPEEMQAQAHDAALRYTFNKPLGPGGKSFSHVVKEWHLEWLFPFITTPGNIFKETARMTPGLNLAVKEWRADYAAGGARRDRAMAEVMMGSVLMAAVVEGVLKGNITGNGNPDKRVRATDHAAGWRPYAVKVNGKYVDGYLKMAPIGPLIGLAADGAEFWEYMTDGERDQWARMLAFAFASNVTNQTFMTGATNFVNVLQDPSRYGENYFESLASSVIPSVLGQTAAEMDPLMREIHGMRDAMIARVPWMREGLMPKKDLFGEPIKNPERLWWGSPFSTSALSTDKVRTEAMRLGFAAPTRMTSLDVLPGKDFGKLDKIPLTPQQKDVFASESGQRAYSIIQPEVLKPDWDQRSPYEQRFLFEKAFKAARHEAQMNLLMDVYRMQQEEVQKKQQQAIDSTKRTKP